MNRDINMQNCNMETIKNCILRLKKIRAKLERYAIDDIRLYF